MNKPLILSKEEHQQCIQQAHENVSDMIRSGMIKQTERLEALEREIELEVQRYRDSHNILLK